MTRTPVAPNLRTSLLRVLLLASHVVLHAAVTSQPSLLASTVGSTQSNVSNVLPRVSSDGSILDAHDSKMLYLNGTFYWFASSYGDCIESPGPNGCANVTTGACGFNVNHNVSLFTSVDLVHWSDPVVVFSAFDIGVPGAITAAPKVIYNPSTGMFVLWLNWFLIPGSPPWSQSFYSVASSPMPGGRFKLQTQSVSTLVNVDVGDLNLMLDPTDGSAYVIYTGHISSSKYNPAHVMSVERLTPTFYESMGAAASSGPIGVSDVEAPMLFRNAADGLYHAVFGYCCCNNADGTAALTDYVAAQPLGPYTPTGIVGSQVSLPAQSTDVVEYVDSISGEKAYLYIGDRWQSAPDRVKAHDFTLFAPLTFGPSGALLPIPNLDSFLVNVSAAAPGRTARG